MQSKEEVEEAIKNKGEEIRNLKIAKPPTLKEDLDPLIKELLALKLSYKQITGLDYDPPKVEKKKKDQQQENVKKTDGPSKSELNKLKRKEAKAAKRAEARVVSGNDQIENKKDSQVDDSNEDLQKLYGDAPLICSKEMTDRVFRQINSITPDEKGQNVWVRARVSNTRLVSKGIFFILRQTINTVQGVLFQGPSVPKSMVKYGGSISLESIIDVCAEVVVPDAPIQSTTVHDIELNIKEIHVISKAQELPFLVEDAGRNEDFAKASGLPIVNPDTTLNYRWVDTRTPANQAIFRIQSGVCQLFREFLISKNFIEIHTPKLIAGASEGGANVFTFSYFKRPACLAQSPQLYKQMASACGGFERVFEIGPVFRAEDSNTHRHLCEFTGLDFEMQIYEHYYEALEVMGELFNFIFDGISERFNHELKIISQQYPFEPIKYLRPPLRITFQEGIKLLNDAGIEASYDEDIGTVQERELGAIVKKKYGTDFYIMDKYPLAARPFYTMPDPNNPKLSNSYDLFIRGEEIVSGAQRIHDVDLLIERANEFNIPISSIQSYVDAFRHGALPHAGGGIGLERVVMLYLGLKNIRKSSMFPRDPSRLTP